MYAILISAAIILHMMSSYVIHGPEAAVLVLRNPVKAYDLQLDDSRPVCPMKWEWLAAHALRIWRETDEKAALAAENIRRNEDMAELFETTEGLKWHPAARAFPLTQHDIDQMTADIGINGQRVPGKAWKKADGTIEGLDGRLRAIGCKNNNRPFVYELLDLTDPMQPYEVIVSLNRTRRHMGTSVKAMVAARWMSHFEKAAKSRMFAGVAELPQGEEKGRTREIVAKIFGISPRLVQDAVTVQKKGCEALTKTVEEDLVTATAAADLAANRTKQEQKDVVAKGPEAVLAEVKKIREVAKKNKSGSSTTGGSTPTTRTTQGPSTTGGDNPPVETPPSTDCGEAPTETRVDPSAPEAPPAGTEASTEPVDPPASQTAVDPPVDLPASEQQVTPSSPKEEPAPQPTQQDPIPTWILTGLNKNEAILNRATSITIAHTNSDQDNLTCIIKAPKKLLTALKPGPSAKAKTPGQQLTDEEVWNSIKAQEQVVAEAHVDDPDHKLESACPETKQNLMEKFRKMNPLPEIGVLYWTVGHWKELKKLKGIKSKPKAISYEWFLDNYKDLRTYKDAAEDGV